MFVNCNNDMMEGDATHQHDFARRRVLLLSAAGVASLAGCLSGDDEDDDTEDDPTRKLSVIVSSTVDRQVTVRLAVIEGDASFEDSVVGRYNVRAGDSLENTLEGFTGGPFRVVLRVEDEQWDDFEIEWDLSECIELSLQATVREGGLGVSWGCTHPR